MKFEEILPLMREGRSAQTQKDKERNIYWMIDNIGDADSSIECYSDASYANSLSECEYSDYLSKAIVDETWEIIE